jgi:hypothetical protein
MTFRVEVAFVEGPHHHHGEHFADLNAACRFALDLADRLGRDLASSTQKAHEVLLYEDDAMILSIRVIDGGLGDKRTPDRHAIL